MADIKTADLIAKFQYAIDNNWGYVLGAWHTMWTQALQNQKVQYMINNYGSNWKTTGKGDKQYYNALNCGKWIGHWVTDCSGLFYWAFKELGGYMYHGSNTMWNKYCANKGKLSKGKRTDGQDLKPGSAVFVCKDGSNRSHVGLYIGNGKVIEAAGQSSGVIYSEITNSKWAEWAELKGVDYSSASTPSTDKKEEGAMPNDNTTNNTDNSSASGGTKSAVVIGTRLALRQAPSTQASIIMRVNTGERVQLLDDTEWVKVKYQGKTGYMMAKYLQF